MNTTPIQAPAELSAPSGLRTWLRIDPVLTLGAIALIACSAFVIAGATKEDIPGDPSYYVVRQIGYGVVGVVLMLLFARFDYTRLRELKYGLYVILIGTIALVLALGSASRGSRRWIELPFFQYQPSELGKVLLILAVSAFVVSRARSLGERGTTARVMLLALFPAMLVIAQPDLGSGLVYVAIAVSIMFVAGTPLRHFAFLGALAATAIVVVLVAAPAVGVQVLQPYQVDRLTAFLNPTDDPQKQGYQQNQSQIAIGSGEKTGRGVAQATQTKFDFLPEHHTDFIFAVVGETYGFAGCALILSLYAMMIWRALRTVSMSKNLYGTLIAGGVLGMLMFQVFVNVGMTIGIMPITGVTLPLMSYGGSSVIVTFIALGLLQSIYAQGREAAAIKQRALAP
jgi:rod shape determining protein RodA